MFKLLQAAEGRWRAVDGPHLVALMLPGSFDKAKLINAHGRLRRTLRGSSTSGGKRATTRALGQAQLHGMVHGAGRPAGLFGHGTGRCAQAGSNAETRSGGSMESAW
jgi:hypothetical protein